VASSEVDADVGLSGAVNSGVLSSNGLDVGVDEAVGVGVPLKIGFAVGAGATAFSFAAK